MMTTEQFEQLIEEIAAQGYDRDLATSYAVLVGDTPELDGEGKVVVRDAAGKELARLSPLKILGL